MFLVNYVKWFSFLGLSFYKILDVVRVSDNITRYELGVLTSHHLDVGPLAIPLETKIASREQLEEYFGFQIKARHFEEALSFKEVEERQIEHTLKTYVSVTLNPINLAVSRLRKLLEQGVCVDTPYFRFGELDDLGAITKKHLIPVTPETYFYHEAARRSTQQLKYSPESIAMEYLVEDWKQHYNATGMVGNPIPEVLNNGDNITRINNPANHGNTGTNKAQLQSTGTDSC